MNAPTPPQCPPISDRRATPRLDDAQVGGDHYSKLAITPWQALEAWLTPEEFRGYLKGEAIVYIARELQKGGKTDIGKAGHVLTKLLAVYDEPTHADARIDSTQASEVRVIIEQFARTGCEECAGKPCQRMDACPWRNGVASGPAHPRRG